MAEQLDGMVRSGADAPSALASGNEDAGEASSAAPTIPAVLRAAAGYVERGWTQHATARDAIGLPLDASNDPRAVCWCAVGAISATLDAQNDPWSQLYMEACIAVAGDDVQLVDWNDAPERTQAEVVAALRNAASRAEA